MIITLQIQILVGWIRGQGVLRRQELRFKCNVLSSKNKKLNKKKMSDFFRSRHAPPTPLISHHSFSQYLPPSWQGHLSIFFNLFHFLFILQKHKQTHTHTHTHTQTRMCTLLSHTLPPVPHSSPPPLPSFSSKVYCKNP